MKKPINTIVAAMCIMLLIAGLARNSLREDAISEERINEMTKPVNLSHQRRFVPAELPALKKRAWELQTLWLKRRQIDISDAIIPFLQDKDRVLRLNAIRLLGRLESSQAELPLRKMLKEAQRSNSHFARPDDITVALERIRSRNRKGKDKLNVFIQSLELTSNDLSLLSQRVQEIGSKANGTFGQKTMGEVVDIVYEMGKSGEDVREIISKLTLHPAQVVKLRGSVMSESEEIDLILDYLSTLNVFSLNDRNLVNHLVSLDSRTVFERTKLRLAKLRQATKLFGVRAHIALLEVLQLSDDARVIPFLKSFAQGGDLFVNGERFHIDGFVRQLEHIGDWESVYSPYPVTYFDTFDY